LKFLLFVLAHFTHDQQYKQENATAELA